MILIVFYSDLENTPDSNPEHCVGRNREIR